MFNAAQDFERRLLPLFKIIDLDSSKDNAVGITKRQYVKLIEGVRASLAVLPVAFFEEFMRALISQYVDQINAKTPRVPWGNLPEKLRKSHVLEVIRNYNLTRNPGENYNAQELRILADFDITSQKILSPKNTPNAYQLISHIFILTNNNPNAERVSDSFNMLGISNIFADRTLINKMKTFDAALSTDNAIRVKLDSIVTRRHSVAHGHLFVGLVRGDLEYNIKFLAKLAVSLQITARKHCKKLLK